MIWQPRPLDAWYQFDDVMIHSLWLPVQAYELEDYWYFRCQCMN